jgi:hypothetical protein
VPRTCGQIYTKPLEARQKTTTIGGMTMGGMKRLLAGMAFAALSPAAAANDFPTAARAEFVFACMAANGQTPEILQKCACAIDRIAESMTYEKYEAAETVMRMHLVPGDRVSLFRNSPWATEVVDELNRAQAAATLRCF